MHSSYRCIFIYKNLESTKENKITTWYLSFFVYLFISLNKMVASCIHVLRMSWFDPYDRTKFCCIHTHVFLIHWVPVNSHRWFHSLAFMKSVAINRNDQVCLSSSVLHVSGKAGSSGNSVSNLLRTLNACVHSSWTNLHVFPPVACMGCHSPTSSPTFIIC